MENSTSLKAGLLLHSQNKIKMAEENKWLYWGTWKGDLLTISLWHKYSAGKVFKFIPGMQGDILVLDFAYYVLKEDIDTIYKIVADKIENDRQWFTQLFEEFEKQKQEISKIDPADIKAVYTKVPELLACSSLIINMDPCIERYLKEKGISLSEVMIPPKKKTIMTHYQDELRNATEEEIPEIVKKYKWIPIHFFMGNPLTVEQALEAKKNLPKEPDVPPVKPEYQFLADLGAELSYQRFNIVEVATELIYKSWKPLEALAKKYSLSFEDMTNFTYQEIVELAETGKLPEDIKTRPLRFGLHTKKGKMKLFFEEEIDKAINSMKKEEIEEVVKGTPAFKGKVIGPAKIVQGPQETDKVEKGDILFAHETTPDYIVAMHKAAAFVTNQGGITSHAAIIARELRKPCIIGTKTGTKSFKDGDLVEVDADKGIVRKVEK